jgi:flagellin-like hook-associated protein FlgL
MTVTNIGARSLLYVRFLGSLRSQLDDLQRQLGTGQKSKDYAGLGLDRGLSVALRSQLSMLSSFEDTITSVGVRLEVGQSVLTRIAAIGSQVRGAALSSLFDLNGGGQTVDQTAAASTLDEVFALLNSQVGNRYLFSGRATDAPAAAPLDDILNGDGTRAGFKQVMAERLQADLGAGGLGRLAITRTGATVSIAEDVAASPFGFKIDGISTSVTGASVNGPAGSPPSQSISFAGSAPSAGQTVTVRLSLPDGSSETITLTATNSATPGPNEFTIGAGNGATAVNLRNALTAAVTTLAQTSLRAASAMAAAEDFFNVDDSQPPQRVAGPPFNTATALVDGTAANTVTWYTGEGGADAARTTAVARVDASMSIAYGMRANEQGFRSVIQALAVFSTATFSETDPNSSAAYAAFQQRVAKELSGGPGRQKVMDIAAELGGAQATLGAAKERHRQTEASLTDLLQSIEGVKLEEVGAQILALQTNLQASLQTTALLYRTTLLNYL